MAQTTDSEPRARGSAPADGNASGSANTSTRRGFSLSGLFGPRQGGSARPQRASTGMGNFLKGWLFLVLGMYVLQILLFVLDANVFHGWLENHYIAGTQGGTKPGSALILGGTTWYLLLFVIMFAALYYVLIRLKILPRDLFGQRSQAQASARAARDARDAGRGSSNGSGARPASPPPLPSGVNPYANRTRAARRELQRQRAATATAVATRSKRGFFNRFTSKTPAAASPDTSATTKKATSDGATASSARPGDLHYQRVRAEQRQRKRRATKR
jgi:hypothetical protein